MSEWKGDTSGGAFRGQGVAVALIAITAGMALVVTYAASDGAIFGLNVNPVSSPNNGHAASNDEATAISREVFDDEENAASQSEESSSSIPTPKSISTRTEEESELLAISNYPWDSIAASYVASSKASIANISTLATAQAETEPLNISDNVSEDVDHDDVLRIEAQNDLGLVDTVTGNIYVQVNATEDEVLPYDSKEGEEERTPQVTEEQELQDDRSGSGNQSSVESNNNSLVLSGSEDIDGYGIADGEAKSKGNSTVTENSTATQNHPEDSGSGGSNSTLGLGITTSIS